MASLPRLRIAVVDPQTVVRTAIPLVLPELAVRGSFRTVGELLDAGPATDAVLLELSPGAGNHPPLTAWTRAVGRLVGHGHRVCIHSAERSRMVLLGCLGAGATAIVHKTDSLAVLREAVRATAAGRRYVTDSLPGLAELALGGPKVPVLTERQRLVLSARARGEKFDSIARRLFISRKVAEEHWAVVAHKFAGFLREHSPADLERVLGLEPVDLGDRSPVEAIAG